MKSGKGKKNASGMKIPMGKTSRFLHNIHIGTLVYIHRDAVIWKAVFSQRWQIRYEPGSDIDSSYSVVGPSGGERGEGGLSVGTPKQTLAPNYGFIECIIGETGRMASSKNMPRSVCHV